VSDVGPEEKTPPIEVLAAVAKGIPRSYPFFMADLAFLEIPLLQLGEPPHGSCAPARLQATDGASEPQGGPGVFLGSMWWTPRRMTDLSASVQLPAPSPDEPQLPPLPSETSGFLRSLGKVHLESISPLLNAEEAEHYRTVQVQTAKITENYRSQLAEMMAALPLPYRLPRSTEMGLLLSDPIGSLKEVLLAAFRPRGYTYAPKHSGQGMYVLSKRTSLGNLVVVDCDAGGKTTRSASVALTLKGLGVHAVFPIPVSAETANMLQYPITSYEQWQKIVENTALVADHIEQTLVPEVEEIWGPCPMWHNPLPI
jgi:hypothetical protein